MVEVFPLLADADVISPWTSAFLQYGSFGLVVYIVTVLAPSELEKYRADSRRRDDLFVSVLQRLEEKTEQKADKLIVALNEQTKDLRKDLLEHVSTILESMDHICQATPPRERKSRSGGDCDK